MLQCARKVRGVPTPQTIFVLFVLVAICQLLRRGDLKKLFDDGAIMTEAGSLSIGRSIGENFYFARMVHTM